MPHFQPLLQVLISEELADRSGTRNALAKSAAFTRSLRHIIAPTERECQQNLQILQSEARGAGRSKMGRVREDSLRTDVLF